MSNLDYKYGTHGSMKCTCEELVLSLLGKCYMVMTSVVQGFAMRAGSILGGTNFETIVSNWFWFECVG